jgi:hypothetical protein
MKGRGTNLIIGRMPKTLMATVQEVELKWKYLSLFRFRSVLGKKINIERERNFKVNPLRTF